MPVLWTKSLQMLKPRLFLRMESWLQLDRVQRCESHIQLFDSRELCTRERVMPLQEHHEKGKVGILSREGADAFCEQQSP
jgi:hypothetical protein